MLLLRLPFGYLKPENTFLAFVKWRSSTQPGPRRNLFELETHCTCQIKIALRRLMVLYKAVGVGLHTRSDSEIALPPGAAWVN